MNLHSDDPGDSQDHVHQKEEITLKAAKDILRSKFNTGEGSTCPCCNQFVKMYRRKLTSSMAYALILLCKRPSWVHVEDYFKELNIPSSIRGDVSKLVHWELIEKQEGKREDGSNRVGIYRITEKGIHFVMGRILVKSHAYIYNNKFYRLDGNVVTIQKCLGSKFNYNELMQP